MPSEHQQHVARYHTAMSQHSHHGGHDMYIFHGEWHQRNRDPQPPTAPNPHWGTNLVFGANFLQMHHEMVKAKPTDPHQHMMHDSIAAWYAGEGIALPSLWDPLTPIPAPLGYEPDVSVYPAAIQNAVAQWAQQEGVSVVQFLTRSSDNPQFELPRYFTRQGVGPGDPGEPITGARKLADFKNVNQLGCCIVFPHNMWHGVIGGAMSTTWTAIADPIFYFGVHWHVDRVYDEFKIIETERSISAFDTERLRERDLLISDTAPGRTEFSDEEKNWIREQSERSARLHRSI